MQKNKSNLAQTQNLLWHLLTAPKGVADCLQSQPMTLPILGDDRLSAVDRLEIYANMYFFRILDSLKEDFPRVLQLVGEDHFHNLITSYLIEYPSTHWSLRYAGKNFATFLKSQPQLTQWPQLVDLAKLEWALLEAFDAPETEVLTRDGLMALGEEKIQSAILKSGSHVFVLKSRWPLLTNDSESQSTGVAKKPTFYHYVIWRRDLNVVYRECQDPEEYKLLKATQQGVTLHEACEIIAKTKPLETAPHLFLGYLNRWLADEMLQV